MGALLVLILLPHASGLSGLTAVVTGANRGLGLALAHGLVERGAHVVVTCRRPGAAADVAASLGGTATAYDAPLDVTDPRSVAAFGAFSDELLPGGVDLLFNNAAVCEPGWSTPVVRRAVRTNAVGPLGLLRAVLPGMLRRRRGHVINVSSGDGELAYLHSQLQAELSAASTLPQLWRAVARASPPRDAFGAAAAHGPTPAYALSKAALNAATRITAAQLLPEPSRSGVLLSAVCPGDVATDMCDAAARASALAPSDAASDVLWLADAAAAGDGALPTGRFWRARREIPF